MIKQLVDLLLESFYKHKMVSFVKYQEDIYINAQNDNDYYQVSIESDGDRLEKQITEGILTIEYNITILGREDVLTAQDNSLHILLDTLEYLQAQYNLNVRDYSVLSLSNYTDDRASGIRATVQFTIPSPLNLCEYMDNFDEDKIIPIHENDLELDSSDSCTNSYNKTDSDNDITLNPIKLF